MQQPKKRTLKDYSILTLFGYLMGAANVIPGVSGGTVAFILGFFKELIESLKAFISRDVFNMVIHGRFKEMYQQLPWRFLAAIGVGAALAVITLAKLLSYLLKNHQLLVYAFFMGLILASIICCFKMVGKWKAVSIITLVLGVAVGYLLVNLVPTETPNTWWCLILCGVIAICAMILPGISGSFMLLILGQYENVLSAVTLKGFNPGVIFWVGVGAVLGLGTMAHFLSWLFRKYNDPTVAALIGFMLGSLVKLWPWQEVVKKVVVNGKEKVLETKLVLPTEFNGQFWAAAGLIILGIIITITIEYLAKKQETPASEPDNGVK